MLLLRRDSTLDGQECPSYVISSSFFVLVLVLSNAVLVLDSALEMDCFSESLVLRDRFGVDAATRVAHRLFHQLQGTPETRIGQKRQLRA